MPLKPFASVLAALLLSASAAVAQISDDVVRIGVLGDMSSPNADQQGPGDVAAARLAVEDFGGKVRGASIEIVTGDLLGKTDVASAIAPMVRSGRRCDLLARQLRRPPPARPCRTS